MLPRDIYNEYLKLVGGIDPGNDVAAFYKVDKNAIRIQKKNRAEFIFRYNKQNSWNYERIK